MSVVADNTSDQQDLPQEGFFSQHPWIGLLLAAAIAFIIYRIFISAKTSASPPSTAPATVDGLPATGDTSGLATDAQGHPILYAATDTFLNYNFASNSYNSTSTTNNDVDENDHGPPVHPPPTPTPTPVPPPVQTKGTWTCRYTVVEGDTLSKIASRYKTTWPVVYGHNMTEVNLIAGAMHYIIPGGAWNNIRPGEVLSVPCTGEDVPPNKPGGFWFHL